jgi:homoserine O-succinyltransferase
MTIILPESYHIRRALEDNRVVCITEQDALRQDIRPLRVAILNVMPKAESYELQILRPLGRSIIQIEPLWIRLHNHQYKSSDRDHIRSSYMTFEEAIRREPVDGLLVTGAPVEEMPYEEVRYWQELAEILRYAREHVVSTLGICWGGMALAKLVGIEKVRLPRKLFGVFPNRSLDPLHPITGDTDDMFWCPQSRHSGIENSALEAASERGDVRLLSQSDEAGYSIFETPDHRYVMHLGHPEYEPERLVFEYQRDAAAGRSDVAPPVNVNLERPLNTWRSHRNEFFSQWIKLVYDGTSHPLHHLGSVRPRPSEIPRADAS